MKKIKGIEKSPGRRSFNPLPYGYFYYSAKVWEKSSFFRGILSRKEGNYE